MNSQRGPPPNSLWNKNQQSQLNPSKNYTQSSTGSLSHRGVAQKPEWAKPTSIISSKPLNQHRSIDGKGGNSSGGALMLRKIDLNNSGGGVNGGGPLANQSTNHTHNFLFNTYSSNGLQNMKGSHSSDQNSVKKVNSTVGGGRHLSIKGWLGNSHANLQQQQQPNSSQKNQVLVQPFPHSSGSHNKTLETSSSASHLMLDSALMHTLHQTASANDPTVDSDEIQYYQQSKDGGESLRINELQHQFDNFNAQRHHANTTGGLSQDSSSATAQYQVKPLNLNNQHHQHQSELAQVLSQFAPPSHSVKSVQLKNQQQRQQVSSLVKMPTYEDRSMMPQKKDINDQILLKGQNMMSPESMIDKNMDSDFEDDEELEEGGRNQDEDINESVILFQQSTHRGEARSDDDPTPKQGEGTSSSLKSYKNSTLSSQDKKQKSPLEHQLTLPMPHKSKNSNKESRNQLHQIYLSHQQVGSSDLSKPFTLDSKDVYQSQQHYYQSDSQNLNKEYKTQSQLSLAGSSNKKGKGGKMKNGLSKIKQQKQLASVTSNNLAAPLSLIQGGTKTPSDVFSYKLKTNTSTQRIENILKVPTTTTTASTNINGNQTQIPNSSNRMIMNSKKSGNQQSQSNQSKMSQKPPILMSRKENSQLGKSESVNELQFYTTQQHHHRFSQKSSLSQQNLAQHDQQPIDLEQQDIFTTPPLDLEALVPKNSHMQFYQTTTNFKHTVAAPPNSDQTLSPETLHPTPSLTNQPSTKSNGDNQLQQPLLNKDKASSKVQILDFDLDNVKLDHHKQSIRVVSRFRPLNKVEKETKDFYANQGEMVIFREDKKSLQINDNYGSHGSNMVFTFDHIFTPDTSQEEVFNLIGKETIDDIMEGYNGTIFAYGQTGSGKTYTMYGQDIFDEDLMGIVPRAARQIFHHIKTQDLEIEYQIRVQMVEIYKEQLRDLLFDSTDHPAPELKIKEDPKRGTYVEGLNDVCIVSEEEIMTVLCTGETMRHVASTRLNQVSSRSHSICIIEIVQKYPNDSERRGVLNLVDLAGSERVSKSQAQGQALEEAKKINFSLSMLGKVINCLTKNAPYIPYRDSKLTRLLKESLGGNNKTSLIVACSMHQSHIEETLSTLRFAQSAKFIENRVKMNIKTSPEQLQLIIEQLKQELFQCKEEIYRLRITATASVQNETNSQQHSKKPASVCNDDIQKDQELQLFQPCSCSRSDLMIGQEHHHTHHQPHSEEKQPNHQPSSQFLDIKHTLHNRPHQSLLAKNYDVIETNNHRMQMLSLFSSEFSSIYGYQPLASGGNGTGTPNFISPVKNYEVKLMQLINRNEDLEMKLKSKDADMEALKAQKEELQDKVSGLEEKIISYKQKLLVTEKKLAEFESDKDFMMVKEVKQGYKLEDSQGQIEVLTQQIKCLEKALEESEKNCQQLLREKQGIYQKSIKDFLNETIKLKRIKVSDALDKYINKPQTTLKKSFISQLDLLTDYNQHQRLIQDASHLISPLNDRELLSQNLYSLEFINALEDTPPELTIYLLKQMLIEASLANHNLQRILAVNRWRQVMEYGKHKIKSMLCKIQENTIETLEQVLDRTRKTHDKLRARVDKLENHLYDNRNFYGDIVMLTDGNGNAGNTNTIVKNFNSLKDKNNQIYQQHQHMHNQSIVSMVIGGNNYYQGQGGNQKSRFIRTITNKTLGKVFNFIEKSPMSRGSVGANNQSILSHYYGQKHNVNYKNGGTPNKTTGGMNSPVFYNFQSPIRRQNTFAFTGLNRPQLPQIVIPQQFNINNKENEHLMSGASTVPNKLLINEDLNRAYLSTNPNVLTNNDQNNEQLTFEDAIVKFFNSSEIEDKNNNNKVIKLKQSNDQQLATPALQINTDTKNANLLLSQEDLVRIEAIDNIQEIKDYLRSKFDNTLDGNDQENQLLSSGAAMHHIPNPLFVQYQNNALQQQQSSSSNLLSSQGDNNPQINSHTTNNNLYGGQSNDFYEGQVPSSQKGATTYMDNNQRQEHVLTIASDYMLTSNSVIGPNALFSGSGQVLGVGGNNHAGQYYQQNDYLDRLQEKIVQLLEEVETQKCRAEEHRKAYYESKKQIEQMRELMEEKESQHNMILKSEICSWEYALNKFKEMNEHELLKKQKENEKLHEILAQWIEQYQELEHNKGIKHQEIDQLVQQTIKHKRNKSGLLSEVMKTPYNKRLSNVMQSMQSFDNRQQYIQQQQQMKQSFDNNHKSQSIISQNRNSSAKSNINQNKQMDKKVINGDNSPIAQEDSCFDFEQSRQNTQEHCESLIELPLQTYNSE